MNRTSYVHTIKGSPKTTLLHCLMEYKKSVMLEIAENINAQVKKSHTKIVIAEQLHDTIIDTFSEKYDQLTAEDQNLLKRLSDFSVKKLSEQEVDSFNRLILSGYLFMFLPTNQLIPLVPEEVKEQVQRKEVVEEVASNQAEEFQSFLDSHAASIKIYGRYDMAHLVSVWNRHHANQLTMEQALQLVEKD